jgi:hypothetical protein
MKIKDIERQLKTGDIIVSRTNFKWYSPLSYLSAAIRFFAKTKYNHAELVVFNWDRCYTNEAVGRGVISSIFGTRTVGKQIRVLRPRFNISEKYIATEANSKLGITPYDVIGLIHQAIYLSTGVWLGKRSNDADKRMYCFEYVAWVYDMDFWYRTTPKDIIDNRNFETIIVTKVE